MSIGGGIFLIVVGAILVFAVNLPNEWVSLDLVGYILMGAGVLILLLGIVLLFRKRSSVSTTRTAVDPATGEGVSRSTVTRDEI